MSKILILSLAITSSLYAKVDYVFNLELPVVESNYKVNNYSINSYFIKNKNSDKLAILVHGYLDNCSYMTYLQKPLWEKGNSILCIELPGHGGSNGERASIDSFNSYAEMLNQLPEKFKNYKEKTFVAHSTGAVALHQYLRIYDGMDFNKIVLIAPLVRSNMWFLASLAHSVFGGFVKTIPRKESNNPKYILHRDADPRHIKKVHSDWVAALKLWKKELETKPKFHYQEMTVFFPEDDKVIDVEYSKKYYKKHFSSAKQIVVEDAGHHIQFDNDEKIDEFMQLFSSSL